MENQSKKTIRSTKAQIHYLCQYMAAHPDFASGDNRSPMGTIQNKSEWTKLKEALDELGPCRSVEQWKICWRDQKAKARSERALLKKAKDATGNILPVPNLTDTSALVLSAIGKEMAVDFAPEESPIGFSEAQPSTSQCPAQPPLQHKAQRPAPYRRAQLELNNLVKILPLAENATTSGSENKPIISSSEIHPPSQRNVIKKVSEMIPNLKDSSEDHQIEEYVDDSSESQDTNSSNAVQEVQSPSIQPKTKSVFTKDQSSYLPSQDQQILLIKTHNPPKRTLPDGGENIYREQESSSKKGRWGDDRYQIFATNVTLKMKDIRNDTQRLLAEKMINEVLFMAEMGQLSMSHGINLTQNYLRPQPSDCNVGSSDLCYHSPNRRQQPSTVVAKNEIPTTSPDCTSDYENEDYQRLNCRNCARRSNNRKDNDERNDPLSIP